MGHSHKSSHEGLWVFTVPNKFDAFKSHSGFAAPVKAIRADEAVSV